MSELKFSNTNDALQHLANLTNSTIKIAEEKVKPLKIPGTLRSQVNNSLNKAGLDGNKEFEQMSHAISAISDVLGKHEMEYGEVTTADQYSGLNGQKLITIAQKNPEDSFSPTPIENSAVYVQWSPLGDTDEISVVAYLS